MVKDVTLPPLNCRHSPICSQRGQPLQHWSAEHQHHRHVWRQRDVAIVSHLQKFVLHQRRVLSLRRTEVPHEVCVLDLRRISGNLSVNMRELPGNLAIRRIPGNLSVNMRELPGNLTLRRIPGNLTVNMQVLPGNLAIWRIPCNFISKHACVSFKATITYDVLKIDNLSVHMRMLQGTWDLLRILTDTYHAVKKRIYTKIIKQTCLTDPC